MRRTLWVSVLVFISMLAFPAPSAGQVKVKKPSVPSVPKVEIAPASADPAASAEPAAALPIPETPQRTPDHRPGTMGLRQPHTAPK